MKRKLTDTSIDKIEDEEIRIKSKKKKKKSKHEVEVVEEAEVDTDYENEVKPELEADEYDDAGYSGESSKKKRKKKPVADDEATAALLDVWPKEKILTLIERILGALPENDNLKYTSRVSKINWNDVSFDEYDGNLCLAMWKSIQERTRCFRLLREIAMDAKEAMQQSSSVFYQSMIKGKHPEMPVKPLSSFMLYYMDVKDELGGGGGSKISCPEKAKKVSRMWKQLPPKKVERYAKKAAILKEEYKEKLEEFYRKHPEFIEEKKKRSKVNADSLGFPKPKSAFQLYYQFVRDTAVKKGRDLPLSQMLEKAKEEWKNMAEDQKLTWIEAARKEEVDYLDKLRKYESEHPGSTLPCVKTSLTKQDRNLLELISGKPKKPPSNAYSLYSQTMLQGNSLRKLQSKERLTEISRRWKSLENIEKEKYVKQLMEMQEEYKRQFDEYIESLSPEERERELQQRPNLLKKKKNLEKKVVAEPEAPPIDLIEFFKSKNIEDWKKKSKVGNEIEFAKKKWNAMSSSAKQNYKKELQDLHDVYFSEYAKFLQTCSPETFMTYLSKLTDHKQKFAAEMTSSV